MRSWIWLQIRRPIACSLMAVSMLVCGWLGWLFMAIAPLPQMDFPVYWINTSLNGANAKLMSQTVSAPLERALSSIAGVKEMRSISYLGSSRIMLMFDFSKDVNQTYREIQAAINEVTPNLPSGLKSRPAINRATSEDDPIAILAFASPTLSKQQLYDYAIRVVAPQLASFSGVSGVDVAGASAPALRIKLNRLALEHYGVSISQVQQSIRQQLAEQPLGKIDQDDHSWIISYSAMPAQIQSLAQLTIKLENATVMRLGDLAEISFDSEDKEVSSFYNNEENVTIWVRRKSNTNAIDTIEQVKQKIPQILSVLPRDSKLNMVMNRAAGIKADINDAYKSLILSCLLVVGVIMLFLGGWRSAIIPAIVIPITIISSFAAMKLLGFSINNMSIMALIVVIGIMVDDAIVVLENIQRHIEKGLSPIQAALKGSSEVAWTLIAITASLIAVFAASVADGGFIKTLFQEFAITLAAAVFLSLIVSLTFIPPLAAHLFTATTKKPKNTKFQRGLRQIKIAYRISLGWVLRFKFWFLLTLPISLALSVWLLTSLEMVGMPRQDTGVIVGDVQADRGTSFTQTQTKLDLYKKIILEDPAVQSITGMSGGDLGVNKAFILIQLKPKAQRKIASSQVIQRIRSKITNETGSSIMLSVQQDLDLGRPSMGETQFEILITTEDASLIDYWSKKITNDLRKMPEIDYAYGDYERGNYDIELQLQRDAAMQGKVGVFELANLLNNSFNKTQGIGTIYQNQQEYAVITELPEDDVQNIEVLRNMRIISQDGRVIPITSVLDFGYSAQRRGIFRENMLSVNSIYGIQSSKVSFEKIKQRVQKYVDSLVLPVGLTVSFKSIDSRDEDNDSAQITIILLALLLVYWVLGMIYGSFLQPLTILSTLPASALGALLALKLTHTAFSLISFLGIFLLVGIVLRNAILLVDFTIVRQRLGVPAQIAVKQAALQRLRPILMTNLAGICAAIPIAVALGEGSEIRQPLGITIIGGLMLSQLLTLYTTPAMYLALETLKQKSNLLISKILDKIKKRV